MIARKMLIVHPEITKEYVYVGLDIRAIPMESLVLLVRNLIFLFITLYRGISDFLKLGNFSVTSKKCIS